MIRGRFHQLRVRQVEPLTADSAAVTFDVPDGLRERFAFAAGQSLTVRHGLERRSYSICAPAGSMPRIGVRAIAGGVVSAWLVNELHAGDTVEVQEPSGRFSPDLAAGGDHVLVAAGSGITPVLSIAGSLLAAGPDTRVTLVYGNRRADSVMFVDDVADLKDAYPNRMQLIHVLSREPQEVELFTGRLDAAKLRQLLPALVDVDGTDHWWLCGPFGMVADATQVLSEFGVPPRRIHRELFYVEDEPPAPAQHLEPVTTVGARVTVILDGRTSTVSVPPGVAVLDAAQRTRPDLPFACKGGVCGTCRARVTGGEVRMRRNYALEPAEVAAGYVLTCQAIPISDAVTVDYDT